MAKEKKKGRTKAKKLRLAGVDIGGTKIYVLITDGKGEVLGKARAKTLGVDGFEAVMEQVAGLVNKACSRADVKLAALDAVGVGAPAPMLPDGTAVRAPNLDWHDEPLGQSLSRLLERPVFGINDCNAGTLAEHTYGAARGLRSVVGLFMGTGLGGGLVLGDRLVTGENHQAAELGHMIVLREGRPCGCGNRGCLEAYASKAGMTRALRHEVFCNGRATMLSELCGEDLTRLRSGALRKAYAAGDELCRQVLHEAVEYLGIGVGNFITMLGPDMVVLGGGVMEAMGELLLPRVKEVARGVTFPESSFDDTRIELAALGDDSVAMGAVAWALRNLG